MAGETLITVVGNLTADPEVRSTQSGTQVAGFTIASTPRTFDRQANEWKDGEALFLRANAWRELANNVAATLTKGMRVIAQGHLKQKSYKDREGNDRTSIELEVVEIGPALTFATAQVTRAGRGGVQQGGQQPNQPTQGYGPPQGSYGPPQGQQPVQQGGPVYPAPQGMAQPAPQQAQPQMQQPQQGYPAPQQAVQQPQQAPVQQQAPPQPQAQPGTQQGAQQGNWGGQPAWGADETPF